MAVLSIAIERTNGLDNTPMEVSKDETTYNLRLVALVSDYLDGQHNIYAHALCPKIGGTYAVNNTLNAGAICKSVKIIPQGGKFDSNTSGTAGKWKWLIEAEYSTKSDDQNKDPQPGEVAKVYFDTEQYDRPLVHEVDHLDKPVLNSAKMQFDPPPLWEDHQTIIRVEKWYPSINPSFIDLIQNKVNSTSWYGYAANTLRICRIGAAPQDKGGYSTSVEIKYSRTETGREEPHQAYVLDIGRYERINAGPLGGFVQVPIKDRDGQPIVDPVMLDGNGRKKGEDDEPVYKLFRRYRKADFNLMGLYP